MVKTEFMAAIKQIAAEKNLPKEKVLEVLESALALAYKKNSFPQNQNIVVKINPNTGEVKVYLCKTVVETVNNPRCEISIGEAKKFKKEAQVGDVIEIECTPPNAGRIAAQTAKQVMLQRLHEAEYRAIYEEFIGREGDIVTGVVQRLDQKQIYIDLGRAEAILPQSEQVPTERYRVGQRLKLYLLEVSRTPKGTHIVVSRSHRNLLRRLLELEIPEISQGIVEIKSVAREAGQRSKVAVVARQEGVDPVGSCVGLRGIRIQSVVNELNGEKIDIIPWHPDPAIFIANALSPAQVLDVKFDEAQGAATVIVPDKQLSLAIGKEGQNARLAAKLTGWRIDIKSASAAEKEKAALETEVLQKEATLKAKEVTPEVALPIVEPVEELKIESPTTEPVKEPVMEEVAIAEEEFILPDEVLAAKVPEEGREIRFAEEIMLPSSIKGSKKAKKELMGKGEMDKDRKVFKSKKKYLKLPTYLDEEDFDAEL